MKKIFLAIICLSILAFSAQARKVTGKVSCDGKALSSVIVTDGESFTQTKGNGRFRFEIADSAEFVYIITPAGYSADWSKGSPEFYQKAEGQDFFSFELTKFGDPNGKYNIIAVGDPQTKTDANFDEFAEEPLDDICQTVKELDGLTIGVALGDICYDVFPHQLKWKKEIVRTQVPFYPSIGNHDHDRAFKNDKQSPHMYKANFGPENYAFFIGKDLVIVLDNIIYHSRSSYEEGYTEEIIKWVGGLMEYIPENAEIYVVQHSPANGRWPRKITDFIPTKWEMVTNYEKLIDLLDDHTVTFLSGHNHINGILEYAPGVTEHNVAAICGTWWETYYCTDGTPRGYKVFTKEDGKLSWYYKSVGKDKDFQYEVYKPGMTKNNPDCVVLNVWDYDSEWKLEWFEDGKAMGQMKQVLDFSPNHAAELDAVYAGTGSEPSPHKLTSVAIHYFAAKPSEGAKEIKIVITNRFGKSWTETVQL